MAQEGCSLHKILPRALQQLASTDTTQDSHDNLGEFFQSIGLDPDEFLKPSDCSTATNDIHTWVDMLQEVMDSKELSHAEMNRKRKKLTFQAFQRDEISSMCIAAEILVEPNAHRMNSLFGRSSAIASLQRLPVSETEQRSKLETKPLSRKAFPVSNTVSLSLDCGWYDRANGHGILKPFYL